MTKLIQIKPMPAPRPRVTRRGTYNPERYTNYKKAIAMQCRGMTKHEGAVVMRVAFQFKYPKSWSKKKKEAAGYHTSKPDTDNLIKGVKDALNGIAYHDDAQVSQIEAVKYYGDRDVIAVEVEEIKNEMEEGL